MKLVLFVALFFSAFAWKGGWGFDEGCEGGWDNMCSYEKPYGYYGCQSEYKPPMPCYEPMKPCNYQPAPMCDYKPMPMCGYKPMPICAPRPPPPPPPKPRPYPVEEGFNAMCADKMGCEKDFARKQNERCMNDMEAENARCALNEAEHAKKADIAATKKNRSAQKASKARVLDEVMVHKINDKTDMSSECEDENMFCTKADIYNSDRQMAKAADRQARKEKAAREAAECMEGKDNAYKMDKKCANKKGYVMVPEYAPYCPPSPCYY